MKYILIGNVREGIFEKSTQKLLKVLNIPLEQDILIAPDAMQHGLFPALANRKKWVSLWIKLFMEIRQRKVIPIFIEEGSYISSMLALKALKEEEEFKDELAKIKDIQNFGEHIHLSALLGQYEQQLVNAFQRNWQGFRTIVCVSSFSLLRDTIEGAEYRDIQHHLLESAGLEVLAKTQHFETVSHISSFNPEIALKENARVYYDMVDRGIDFITIFSWNNFQFYEHEAHKIKKAAGRDMLDTPLLHLSEVLLLLLGQSVPSHKIPLGML